MGFSVTGNNLRLDIDQYLKLPFKFKDNTYNLVQVQYENRELANQVIIRDKCMLTNNWAKEKWVPIDIKCDGKITEKMCKFIIEDPQYKGDLSRLNRIEEVNFDTYRIKSSSSAEDFLKKGKLDLKFKKIEMQDPVFVHFEFDN